jgi:type III pantothenate kinase
MLLAIDIGNTNIVLGVFDGEKLKATWRLSTDVHKLEDEYSVVLLNLLEMKKLAFSDIDHAVIASSVPPLVTIFGELCRRYFNVEPLIIGPGTKTGVRIELDNPREAGADRIVNAAAAHSLYEGPLVVIGHHTGCGIQRG